MKRRQARGAKRPSLSGSRSAAHLPYSLDVRSLRPLWLKRIMTDKQKTSKLTK
jgi:hypothetical protein